MMTRQALESAPDEENFRGEGSCPRIGVKKGRGTRWIGMKMRQPLSESALDKENLFGDGWERHKADWCGDQVGSAPSSRSALDEEDLFGDRYVFEWARMEQWERGGGQGRESC